MLNLNLIDVMSDNLFCIGNSKISRRSFSALVIDFRKKRNRERAVTACAGGVKITRVQKINYREMKASYRAVIMDLNTGEMYPVRRKETETDGC